MCGIILKFFLPLNTKEPLIYLRISKKRLFISALRGISETDDERISNPNSSRPQIIRCVCRGSVRGELKAEKDLTLDF